MHIETPRLILRDYRIEDWNRVHLYASIPEFSVFEDWGPNSDEDTKKFVADMVSQSADNLRWKYDLAVCLKSDGLLIGGCGIRRESPESVIANLGWAINPDFQKQGYASEAARALIEFGFQNMGLKIIYATCDSRNVASIKVMEKIGLKSAGIIKAHKVQKGVMRDTLRFEITSLK